MFLSQPEESCPRVYLLYIPWSKAKNYRKFLGIFDFLLYSFFVRVLNLYSFLYICSGQYNISREVRIFILSPAPYTLFHWRLPVSVGHRRFQSLLFRKLTTSTVSVPTSQDIDDICLSAKKQRWRWSPMRIIVSSSGNWRYIPSFKKLQAEEAQIEVEQSEQRSLMA